MSYFKEQHLESIVRPESILSITLKKGRLMLGTEATIYSWDDHYMNYVWGLEAIDWSKVDSKKVLIIGMGLGAVIYILEKKFKIHPDFTAVEYDSDVIYFAKKYSLPRFKSNIRVIHVDGQEYLLKSNDKFDFIVLDVCIEDVIPPGFETIECMEAIRRNLNKNGVLLYNRFYSYYKDQYKTDKFFKNTFKQVFPEGYLLDQKGTCLLVNDRNLLKESVVQ
ncbi:MAG: class I SAM-dependent methyltransferase [Saprospiraceae bacterium]|nr:class I SAM-dependent methyltransferase [Saprospiraceae bacterium]